MGMQPALGRSVVAIRNGVDDGLSTTLTRSFSLLMRISSQLSLPNPIQDVGLLSGKTSYMPSVALQRRPRQQSHVVLKLRLGNGTGSLPTSPVTTKKEALSSFPITAASTSYLTRAILESCNWWVRTIMLARRMAVIRTL
jgi:hypothetical protein